MKLCYKKGFANYEKKRKEIKTTKEGIFMRFP